MPKRKTPKTSRPTPIARPTSGRGTPGPKCGHNQSGQRWSTEECSALEEGIDFHGTAWVKVVEHLSTYGISRTVAMCRNRWQRRTADTSGATNTCQVCNAFPAKGHSCPGGVDVAPKAAGQIGPPGNAFGSAFGAPRDAILSKQIVHVVGTSMSRTGKEAQEENVVSNLRTCPAKLCAPPSAEGVQMIAKLVFAQDRQPIPCSQCDGYGCCEHLVSEKGAQACVKDGVADFCNLKLGKEAYGSKYGRALFQWCFEPCDPATRLEFPGLVVHSAPFRAKTKLVRPLADRVDGGKPEQSVPNLDEQAVDEGEDLGDFSDIDEEDIEVESSGLQRSVSVRPPSPHGGPPPSMNPQPCGSAISHTFGSHGTHASASASCCGEPPPFVHSSLAVYAPPSGSFDTDASRFGLL